MKRTLLLAVLMIGAGKLMAQNNLLIPKQQPLLDKQFNVRVDTIVTLPLLKGLANMPQTNTLKNLYDLKKFSQPVLADAPIITSDEDRMPIAKLQGYSKMPVVKLDGNSKMPIVGQKSSNPAPITLARP